MAQMRVGGLKMRVKDEQISLKHGCIGQETCGAGGMAYGLRSCVDMIEAIHQIRQYSPEAWILNYSTPAAIVAEALRREFPDDKKILNICDQPENVVRSTSRLLGYDWEDLDPVYFGLNHYGWFTHIYDKNTGELMWEYDMINPTILDWGLGDENYLFYLATGNTVYALDKKSLIPGQEPVTKLIVEAPNDIF